MARPKAIRTDLGPNHPVRMKFAALQMGRRETMLNFMKVIANPAFQQEAVEDDELFYNTIRLICEDYKLPQVWLAENIKITSAAISRWISGASLPPAYARPSIIIIAHRLMTESDDYAMSRMQPGGLAIGSVQRPPACKLPVRALTQ